MYPETTISRCLHLWLSILRADKIGSIRAPLGARSFFTLNNNKEMGQTTFAESYLGGKRDFVMEKKRDQNNGKHGRSIDGRYAPEVTDNAIPGINTPGISLPAYNPPVPNRAWTAMRMGKDIDELTEEEKADLYLGRDRLP